MKSFVKWVVVIGLVGLLGYGGFRVYQKAQPWVAGITQVKKDFDSFKLAVQEKFNVVADAFDSVKARYEKAQQRIDQLMKFLGLQNMTAQEIEGMTDEEFESLLQKLREQR